MVNFSKYFKCFAGGRSRVVPDDSDLEPDYSDLEPDNSAVHIVSTNYIVSDFGLRFDTADHLKKLSNE